MEFRLRRKYMQRLHWCLGSILLGATLIAPAGVEARDRHENCPNNGYYDRDHRDCHTWDEHEGRAYQSWQEARHKTHREYSRLKAQERSEYWKWRHEHPDDDRDRH
jgi:hypothetical protein